LVYDETRYWQQQTLFHHNLCISVCLSGIVNVRGQEDDELLEPMLSKRDEDIAFVLECLSAILTRTPGRFERRSSHWRKKMEEQRKLMKADKKKMHNQQMMLLKLESRVDDMELSEFSAL
jgi:hypothetical protein